MLNHRNYLTLILGLALLTGISSCKSRRALVKSQQTEVVRDTGPNAADLLFKQVVAHKNRSEAITFEAEAEYKDSKQNITLNMELTARRNQYIFLNAKAFGLVNVARVMIQPDSIRILDLVNRKYISASYRYMQNYSSAPIGFEQLQNLIWGNALFDPQTGNTNIDSLNQVLKLVMNLGNTSQTANYSMALKTNSVVLSEQGKSQEMQVRFGDLRDAEGMSYPHEILINIQAEKKVECKFTISNFATTIKKEPQFVVPKSYKVQVF